MIPYDGPGLSAPNCDGFAPGDGGGVIIITTTRTFETCVDGETVIVTVPVVNTISSPSGAPPGANDPGAWAGEPSTGVPVFMGIPGFGGGGSGGGGGDGPTLQPGESCTSTSVTVEQIDQYWSNEFGRGGPGPAPTETGGQGVGYMASFRRIAHTILPRGSKSAQSC
jgi:hypothetical protein